MHGRERGGRGALRTLALLTCSMSLLAMPATAGAASSGGLKQLGTSAAGCLADEAGAPPAGCTDARGMQNVTDVVTSPDGKNVYVSSLDKDAIAIFNRTTSSGALTQKSTITGCVTSNAAFAAAPDGCNLIGSTVALDGVTAMAISGDGKSLYTVNNQGKASVFNRASDGTLTYLDTDTCCSQAGATAVIVSPDGKNVYATGPYFSSIVVQFTRDTTAGANFGNIDFANCYGNGGGCSTTGVANFANPTALALTPDGKELLVTTSNSVLLGWDRDPSTGTLTPSASVSRCVSPSDLGATCQARQGIFNFQALSAVSNSSFQALSQYGFITVTRNASNNALTPDAAGNCFTYPTSSFAGCTAMPGTNCCSQWYQARDIVTTNDGRNVYVGTEPAGGGVFGFNRSGGSVSLKPALRCTTLGAADGCALLRGGNRIQALAASGDSRNVYGGGNNRLFSFALDRPPVCSNVAANTVNTSAVRVTFKCSDPDGDVLTYQKLTDPARGTLAGVSGNGVSYGPQPGTKGTDSFLYRAVGAGVPSDPATAFVNVSAPASGGGGGTPTTVVPSTVSIGSLAFPKFTKLTSLSVKNLQAGSSVLVTCKTKKKKQQKKGCPFKKKRLTTSGARARLSLTKRFKKRKIPVGTKIGITITAPGFLGKRITYTIRKRKVPKSKVQCLSASGRAGSCA
jgi:hypothetical protein